MTEILKTLWAKLYAWALPSALALGATWQFLLPQELRTLAKDEGLVFFTLITGALAISLSSLSTILYRFLEGYLWPRWLQEWGLKRERARKKALHAAVRGSGWRHNIALENLSRYPMDDRQILPTRFGNAIRAFESYGKTRFNMDSQTLWHELVAVAPPYIQSEIDSAQSSVDFFVALFYLSLFFCIACLVLGAIEHFKLLLAVPAFLLAILCYWLAIKALHAWSYPIRALVNLGRVKLADSLGLMLPDTIEKEKEMWGLVTRYVYYASPEYGEPLNAYRKPPTEQGAEQGAGEEAGAGSGGTDAD
ncbi:MAG: hypothetical protein WA231_22365 [Methylocella sp.]